MYTNNAIKVNIAIPIILLGIHLPIIADGIKIITNKIKCIRVCPVILHSSTSNITVNEQLTNPNTIDIIVCNIKNSLVIIVIPENNINTIFINTPIGIPITPLLRPIFIYSVNAKINASITKLKFDELSNLSIEQGKLIKEQASILASLCKVSSTSSTLNNIEAPTNLTVETNYLFRNYTFRFNGYSTTNFS